MPAIRDFAQKKSGKKSHPETKPEAKHEAKVKLGESAEASSSKAQPSRKRRPGRSDEGDDQLHMQEVEYVRTASSEPPASEEMSPKEPPTESPTEPTAASPETFHLQFYGSEILRDKIPQAFELAEAVAKDWLKDGDFSDLPLENPWAQALAAQGLQQMKKAERKLDSLGVIPAAKMGLSFVKAKIKK